MCDTEFPHHKVVLQNLYSSKAGWNKALRHGYTIAQARADVLFALLFGGQICFSAGAFFDSPIAVRVFGELCSHPQFDGYCRNHGWRPLLLNTDRLSKPSSIPNTSPSPIDFIVSRWRDPKMCLTFFRELETGFDDPDRMRAMKDIASLALEREEYGKLSDEISSLFNDHQIALQPPVQNADDDPEPGAQDVAEVHWRGRAFGAATTPAILTAETGNWLKGLIAYLLAFGTLENRDAAKRPGALDEFFPVQAILERTRSVQDTGTYQKEELNELNREFCKMVGDPKTMNPVHNRAPSHYGHYYPLIEHWMETEWHQIRHKMYGSDVCILSSDWHVREVFDFDPASKASYLREPRIDDSLRFAQEGFGEISWDILYATITDSRWRALLRAMRAEKDRNRRRKHADAILNLLASKLSEFEFESDNGFLSINTKRLSKLGYLGAYAGVVAKYHNTLEGLLGAHLAGLVEGIGAIGTQSKAMAPALRPLLKGAQYSFGLYKGRQLRRAIVPDIYGGRG